MKQFLGKNIAHVQNFHMCNVKVVAHVQPNETRLCQVAPARPLRGQAHHVSLHYFQLGVVFLEQGRPGDALVYFNKALELDPDHEVIATGYRKISQPLVAVTYAFAQV